MATKIITRDEWGARAPKYRYSIPIPTDKYWLHHAAGSILPGDDSISDADLRRIRAIQDYHMDNRGWSDIAYSWLMDPDGNVFEGRGAGFAGGHTKGQNTVSHALCVMGNYDTQAVDSDLIPRIVEFSIYAHGQGWNPQLFTGGHKDAPLAATSCPGRNLYAKLPEINRLIQEGEDMPTPQEIAQAVWDYSIWDEPAPVKASLALSRTNRNASTTANGIPRILATLGSHDAADVDEAAIAAQIVDSLSDTLAQEVADELAARLGA